MAISAVVLVKNEEKNIQRCLSSLAFCKEIIVVDDNSKDKTVPLAEKSGAKVFIRDMNKNFAEQSNFGMLKAKNEWIIFIDADEVVSEDLKTEIEGVVEKERGIAGYDIPRIDFMWGSWLKHGEIGSLKLTRLIKRGAGKWIRRVHPIFNIKGKTGKLKNPILHYPHPKLEDFIASVDRWSSWHVLANQEEGKTSSLFKIIFWPPAKFIYNYVFKLGFLDGIQGFLVAIMMSLHSYLAWSKLWLLQKKKS